MEDKFLYLVSNSVYIKRLENIKDIIEENLFELFNKKYEVKIISKQKYDIEYKKVINNENKRENENINIDDVTKLFPEGIVSIE